MINITSVYQFGTGTLAIAPGMIDRNTADVQYYVRISALKDNELPGKIGEFCPEKASDIVHTILTFPSENHMLKVCAALLNKSFEDMVDKWNEHKFSSNAE